jgi:DAK2 domain fusion protein YloV
VQVRDSFDADLARRWLAVATRELDRQRAAIDDLNVFPVPDGDTGTNLAATLGAADQAAGQAAAAADAADVLEAATHGAVLNARGNSGVIISQFLRGFAENIGAGTGTSLRTCLIAAASLASAAVAEPKSGTMLTVMEAAAEAEGDKLGDVLADAAARAVIALALTPEQLPELARAGVVDAGGRGVVVLLHALLSAYTGEEVPDNEVRPARSAAALRMARESGSSEFAFEVQYLLDAGDDAATRLRGELMMLGDSVVIVGTGSGTWNVHVHVNDVGAAIEAGIGSGQVRRVSVVHFVDQHAAEAADEETVLLALDPEGLHALLASEGVQVVDAFEVSEAIAAARKVVLFPGKGAASLDDVVTKARAAGAEVAVVPTRSPLQVLAAIAVHDVARRFQDDVIAMAEAAAATRFAEVRVAEDDALTTVGPCRRGDVLGLIDGDVVHIGRSVAAVALAVTDRLLGTGGELITILVGADCPPDSGQAVARHVANVAPFTEVVVYEAGQDTCPLMIGME